jgi:hypothetical protein
MFGTIEYGEAEKEPFEVKTSSFSNTYLKSGRLWPPVPVSTGSCQFNRSCNSAGLEIENCVGAVGRVTPSSVAELEAGPVPAWLIAKTLK